MIDRPSLLETPNLANKSTFIESPVPGESVDDCYAWDSLIRGDYDGTDLAEWEDGKQVQETLPAAQWDAMIHDITALSYQLSQVCNSLWEEMYCIIHGAQVGMSQEAITQLLSGAQTFTNKTISFDDNTLQNIASLDTAQTLKNKTISFDDNTLQNVASLDTVQTLKNKTIKSQDNTLVIKSSEADLTIDRKQTVSTNSPTVISTTQTLTPTKELNVVIDTASVVLTLGSGPYSGYELPIMPQADCSIIYNGVGGTVTDTLTAGRNTNYIWSGTYWIPNDSDLPFVVTGTTTITPSYGMNIVVTGINAAVTIGSGAYNGQKISVTARAACSIIYAGPDGTITESLAVGQCAQMIWTGTHWFCSVTIEIDGTTDTGTPFSYQGQFLTGSVPAASVTVTADGATLDPSVAERFLLNIGGTHTCSIADGIYQYQKIDVTNIGADVTVSYPDGGNVRTIVIPKNITKTFIWRQNVSGWIIENTDDRPPIGVPTLWMARDLPDWALDFGNGASTKYLWSNYPALNTYWFRRTLDSFKTTGGSGLCADWDSDGFYVPDLRGLMLRLYGTNGKGYTSDNIGTVGSALKERLPNILGTAYWRLGRDAYGVYGTFQGSVSGAMSFSAGTASGEWGPFGMTSGGISPGSLSINASTTTGTGNGIYQNNAHVTPSCFGVQFIVRFK